jgi:hypothetical protein
MGGPAGRGWGIGRGSAFNAGENAKQPSTSRIVPNVMFNLFIFNFPFFDCLGPSSSSKLFESVLAVHRCTARDVAACYAKSCETADPPPPTSPDIELRVSRGYGVTGYGCHRLGECSRVSVLTRDLPDGAQRRGYSAVHWSGGFLQHRSRYFLAATVRVAALDSSSSALTL